MKKHLLILGFIFSLNAFSQTPTGFFDALKKQTAHNTNTQKVGSIINLKDSTYRWFSDTATNLWRNPDRTIYTYNTLFKENSFVNSNSTAGSWQDLDNCTNYIYDSNTNLLSQIFKNWNGVAWENNYQLINTYDASNNKLTEITQYWGPTNSVWNNTYKKTYTYDSANNKLSEFWEFWDSPTSSWLVKNYCEWSIYTYDIHNNLTTLHTKKWDDMNMVWATTVKDSVSYNVNDQYTSFVHKSYGFQTGSYWASKLVNIVYSAGNLVNYEWQYWNGTTFDPGSNYQDLYNSNHKIINSTSQYWQTISGSWANNTKIDYTYDVNDNQITCLNQQWYKGSWVNYYRIYDYYTSSVGVKELTVRGESIIIYPNPASNTIILSSASMLFDEVNIVDITGKIVLLEKINQTNSTKINVNSLQSGIYFISLKNEKASVYKKFIKE